MTTYIFLQAPIVPKIPGTNMNYILISTPIFSGFANNGNQLYDISAILPTGRERFVIQITVNTELVIHQAICDRINGVSTVIGQDPVDSINGHSVPPPPVLSQLVIGDSTPDNLIVANPTIDASITDSIVKVG